MIREVTAFKDIYGGIHKTKELAEGFSVKGVIDKTIRKEYSYTSYPEVYFAQTWPKIKAALQKEGLI